MTLNLSESLLLLRTPGFFSPWVNSRRTDSLPERRCVSLPQQLAALKIWVSRRFSKAKRLLNASDRLLLAPVLGEKKILQASIASFLPAVDEPTNLLAPLVLKPCFKAKSILLRFARRV